MIEKRIVLDKVHPVEFYGTNNENLRLLQRAFPRVKFVARGNELLLVADEEDLDEVEEKVLVLVNMARRKPLSPEQMMNIIATQDEREMQLESKGGEVILRGTDGRQIRPKTIHQKELVLKSAENDLVFAIGPAGTGKTYNSVALAVKALKAKRVKKIILTRPAVEAGENLGFLPGDLKEKIDPYLRPLYDALDEMISPEKLRLFMENRVIEIAPLAFMRGRTLNNAFVILDEAQNCTEAQLKMFLTRMGPDAKVIVNGDLTQIDLPTKTSSGLPTALRLLKDVEGIGQVYFDTRDVIRHALVRRIIKAYDAGDREKSEESSKKKER